jgi:hypothetical protein
VAAAADRDWEKARERFGEACRRMYHPFIFASLGQVELELGMNLRAAEHLARFLRAAPSGEEPAKVEKVRELLERAKAKIGTVTIQGVEDGAEVWVDDALMGRAPLRRSIFVEPGLRVFVARSPASPTQRSVRFISTGATVEVDLSVLKSDEPQGSMSPRGSGAEAGATNLPSQKAAASEKASWVSRPATKAGIAGLAAGTISAAVGGAFLIYHKTLPGFGSPSRAFDPAWESWADKQRDTLNFAEIGLGVGAGLGLAGSAVLFFDWVWKSPDVSTSGDRLSVTVGPTGSGLGVSGRW